MPPLPPVTIVFFGLKVLKSSCHNYPAKISFRRFQHVFFARLVHQKALIRLSLVLRHFQQIHAVEFVRCVLRRALAFQKRDDLDLLPEQGGEKAFPNVEVCFVAQNLFGGPVKADQRSALCCAHTLLCLKRMLGINCRMGRYKLRFPICNCKRKFNRMVIPQIFSGKRSADIWSAGRMPALLHPCILAIHRMPVKTTHLVSCRCGGFVFIF